ncbi:tRNA (adenosine(37)-N6)-threonylcarbamoyltransferase complex dimerization subunit type 1 TsaB [Entomospira culicis]|uniref:tRNA (Adenosine(37)-N6)-threonylcarbamoyltransferase complex dimerization subunit type 1 TsaB n=1 Tax=Entomospira culicis TaxID=2719989 RepID=A0A968GIV3_9SPIO|nr:tRNA (adenosine(37)-N6)-threonylcarbamoyltransferase complex dimerization subunit type 1 TsaB [Entomospira culicis]NIZ18449.1 tRNA (adenosine(37)-N6)-threonylcarbamoyltransferase complex dimerization subunit type 1 TsaB [Entomospira culicis]NIZ68665.1 tRNA (adenosine(37)-N6)-threonylcarbamoyltransferase complex dimerization subunit type 1 TsaB [Entomospira culicis]WDI37264.1 tRNA (adenosine(37)-N6)-threonylcarbamoyltransferase complex dimerization subunit type 1 TsaB [Entomospira culicis]WDI
MELSKPNILSIDSAGAYLGVALLRGDTLYEERIVGDSKQQEALTPTLQRLVAKAELTPQAIDLITVMRGPGTFTGLRVGMAAGKGIAYALKKPLVSLSTLLVYAEELKKHTYSAVILDARKHRYYAQLFHFGKPISEPLDIGALELSQKMTDVSSLEWWVSGYGVDSFMQEIIRDDLACIPLETAHEAKAGLLARLAFAHYQELGADDFAQGPMYLRLSEAQLSIQSR